MKAKTLVYFLLAFLLTGCGQTELVLPDNVPECIVAKINYMQKDAKERSFCKEGAQVKEYIFQDKPVYTFYAGYCCSDACTSVYDSNCKYLGGLGGLVDIHEINGEDFYNATFIRSIWEN